MGSKAAILILGLLAAVFLISSEVAARDLAEASAENAEVGKEANEVGDAKYGGYTGHGGHGGGHGHGGHYGGGYCRYGCCGGYYGGRCGRCCSYAGEAVEAQTEVKHHN